MTDFWISCGHHLLDRDEGGGLLVTDEFLKAYLVRPELVPPEEACAAERGLHAALLAVPRRPVDPAEVAAIADADARENWQFLLAFRDLLLRHPTLEAAYLAAMRGPHIHLPPLFVNQMVHVILRNALDGCEDAYVLRAAELFFRPQRVLQHEGAVVLADEETIGGIGQAPLSPLVSMLGVPAEADIDILNDDNAAAYFHHSDQFDLGLDITAGTRGPQAIAEVIRRWIGHLLALEVEVAPLAELRDAKLVWYVGLDAEATRIGDALWNGENLPEEAKGRVLGLFQLSFMDPARVLDSVGTEPVYLIMAMTADKLLRVKPQNLLTGLPVHPTEPAT
jgi:hypothetical protein